MSGHHSFSKHNRHTYQTWLVIRFHAGLCFDLLMKATHKFAISILSPVFYHSARAIMTAKTAVTTTTTTTSIRSFHGRVVARNLPIGVTGDDEVRGKPPLHRQMDPSTLISGSGPLHYRPTGPRIEPEVPQNDFDMIGPRAATASNGGTSKAENWTTLQIYIYGDKNGPFTDTINFQLNREANEAVENSLKRMEISLSKKLRKRDRRNKGTEEMSTLKLELPPSSIWKLDKETMEKSEEWVSALSTCNRKFWGQTRTQPCVVRLPANDTMLDLLVEYNPPTIFGVRTFEDFESHLYVGVPTVLDLDLYFCDTVEASWFVGEELVQQDENLCFTPRSIDAGKSLSVVLRPLRDTHDGRGYEEAYAFKQTIETPPENYILSLRPTWTVERDTSSQQNIRILTYNILADQNAFEAPGVPTRFYQSYVEPWILRKQRRFPLILQEILAYQADVVCLQEVDRGVFGGLLEPVMRYMGYEGYFSEKSSTGNQEGCAMFWSLACFESVPENQRKTHPLKNLMPSLENHEPVEDTWPSDQTIRNLFEKRHDLYHTVRLTLGHVVQMVPLIPRGLGQKRVVWVANTHIFFHPDASHIRTLQMYAICRQLSRELEERPGAVVVCGDFNANLTDPAGRILVERYVPANAKHLKTDLNRFSWSRRRRIPPQDQTDFPALELPAEQKGVFPTMQSALSEAAPVTHFIEGFQGTLDHIVVGGGILPLRHAPLPSMRDLGRHTAMPSEFLPSDHVSLVAEVKFEG